MRKEVASIDLDQYQKNKNHYRKCLNHLQLIAQRHAEHAKANKNKNIDPKIKV
jgi:hypothetical protein